MSKILPPSPPYLGPPKWHGAATNKPVGRIVIHCTAGAEPGVKGAARSTASYTKATSRPSSWHYCADSLESVQLTYDSVIAYHDGTNSHSIGYELSCSLSNQGGVIRKATASAKALTHWQTASHKAMLRIAARDVARLCLAYDVPIRRIQGEAIRNGSEGICGHNDMRIAFPGSTTHWDPGPFFPWRRFLEMVRAEAKALTATPTPPPAPAPAPVPTTGRTLTVGWWNMRRDRDKTTAARQALDNFTQHDLDALILSETSDYFRELCALPGVRLVGFDGKPGQKDTAILVRDGVDVSQMGIQQMTRSGWVTVRGGNTPPKWMPHCVLDGWLRVGSIHTAPSVEFDRDDTPEGPAKRVASTIAHARAEVAFAKAHPGALLVPGDRNATPDDRGKYSPWWISRKTGMKLIAPEDPTHGKGKNAEVIDFALGRGVSAEAVTQERDGSDHGVVVAVITEECQ